MESASLFSGVGLITLNDVIYKKTKAGLLSCEQDIGQRD
jgi:hypothetical protein